MTRSDAQIARGWAERAMNLDLSDDVPIEGYRAAARHILATTTPPTMADIAWDDEVHAGLCAEHPVYGTVRMLEADTGGAIRIFYVEEGLFRRQWVLPAKLTPIPGTKIDLTPRREPAAHVHPVTLSSVEDYDNAPTGTVIAYADDVAVKRNTGRWQWSGQVSASWAEDLADADPCTVVRWGK